MSKKNERAVTPAELAKINAVIAAENVAKNKKARADIAFATAQQDKLEVMQDVANRYRLKDNDLIDPKTGVITRT